MHVRLMRQVILILVLTGVPVRFLAAQQPAPQPAEMAGYLLVPNDRVDKSFDAGFSMYVAAWPLLKNYPGQQFQSGLFGTWMFAQYDTKPTEKVYSDIEGGLGCVARHPVCYRNTQVHHGWCRAQFCRMGKRSRCWQRSKLEQARGPLRHRTIEPMGSMAT